MLGSIKSHAFVDSLSMVNINPDELAHYGVEGMRWGRRRSDAELADRKPKQPRKIQIDNSKKKYRPNSSSDHVQSRELIRKRKNELSNQEIQKIVDRLQKEQKLKKVNPNSLDRGKQITLGVIATGTAAAGVYNLVNSQAGKAAISRGAQIVDAVGLKIAEVIVKSL